MDRALLFLIETFGSLLVGACLLRALAWRVRLPARDPLCRLAIVTTDWLVAPLQRVFRTAGTLHVASLVAAGVVALVAALLWSLLMPVGVHFAVVLPRALVWLLKWAVYLVAGLVLVQAILSWVNPQAPVAPTLDRLTQPLLAPVRRILPNMGGVDLSPLVLLVLAQVALALLDSLFYSLLAG